MLACRSHISHFRAFVRKTSGLINSGGLTGEPSQVGVMLEINLLRKCVCVVGFGWGWGVGRAEE